MFEPFIEKAFQAIKNAKLAPVLLEQVNTLEQHLAFISEKLTNSEKDLAKAEAKVEEQAQEIQFLQAQIATFDGKAKSIESVFGNFSFYSYKKACGQKKTVRGSKNSRRLSNGTPAI